MKALNKQTGQLEKVYVKALDSNPVGSVMEYLGTTAPKNYLLLDGEIHNINQYPQLANLIKDTFGSYDYFGGNGTTTFGLPDMRGRVPVGVDVRDVDFETIGKIVGNKSIALTDGNMPKNVELIKYGSASSAWGLQINNTEYQVKATGQGTPVDVIQPSMAWNFIIKAVNTTPTGAHIVDGYSTSTTDGYSCNEANTLFQTKGQVLWTNPNPTSGFDSQIITLASADWDYCEIIYKNYMDSDTFESQRIYKDYIPSELGGTFYYNNYLYTGTRKITSQQNGIILGFGYAQGIKLGDTVLAADTKWIVPIKIIGYKN